jgi:hypothetical protein
VHPFKVELDAFLGDVAVHPVPPDTRAGTGRRIFEAGFEGIGAGLRRGSEREGCGEGECE